MSELAWSNPAGEYHVADVLDFLRAQPDASVQCVVTSPPYWRQRDYGVDGQLGLESTVEDYVERLRSVFHELRRSLRDDGTLWLNLGDAYATRWGTRSNDGRRGLAGGSDQSRGPRPPGYKDKDLILLPFEVASALRRDGWVLRSDIIWNKPNGMTESVTDRPTRAHEYLFLLAKSERYFYDAPAIRTPDRGTDHRRHILNEPEPSGGLLAPHRGIRSAAGRNGQGANARTVWTIATEQLGNDHHAAFPTRLVEPCVLAGSREGDVVLDPFMGSGTVALVAQRLGRRWLGCDLNPDYAEMARKRCEEFTRAMAL